MAEITDKDRLDFLQKLNNRRKYTGSCCLRDSATGRGWRLHETRWPEESAAVFTSVRDAIDYQIRTGHLLTGFEQLIEEQK